MKHEHPEGNQQDAHHVQVWWPQLEEGLQNLKEIFEK
jgi:hypothetical protein